MIKIMAAVFFFFSCLSLAYGAEATAKKSDSCHPAEEEATPAVEQPATAAADKEKAAAAIAVVVAAKPAQEEGSTHCERPSENNPDVGGTDPKKIGCKCIRTCENGNTIESTEPAKKCKNYCRKYQCDCPDPCKT